MHIRIINPTITKRWEADTLKAYRHAASPGVETSVVTLDQGTVSIESYRDLALVIPAICGKALEAQKEGVDAVIVDCMIDPGVPAARELLTIPIIGPAEASMRLAAILGHRFSVLTVLDVLIPMVEDQVYRYGLMHKLASVRSLDIPVLELDDDLQATLQTVIDVGEQAIRKDGAHVIVPGCTSLAGMASQIQAGLAERGCYVTVVDPPSVAIQTIETLVSLGLSHSKRTFASPIPKPYHWPGLTLYES